MSCLLKTDDRFFVAGATGMAGSAICRELHKKDMATRKNVAHY